MIRLPAFLEEAPDSEKRGRLAGGGEPRQARPYHGHEYTRLRARDIVDAGMGGSAAFGTGCSIERAWGKQYLLGRYEGEWPLKFAVRIEKALRGETCLSGGRGLYVGCGNGRNYVMLARSGLDIVGLDVSAVGLAKIAEAEPGLASRLVRVDFLEYGGGKFSYVVAIQSFQHGNDRRTGMYFRHRHAC